MQNYRERATALVSDLKQAVFAFVDEVSALNIIAREPATLLRIGLTGIEVLRRDGGREEQVFAARARPQEAIRRVAHVLGESLGRDCAIEIAAGLSVTGRMILPSEAEDVLNAIIRNKVESIAPWPLAQSLHGQRIAPIPGDAAHVVVDVAVVSRALLEDAGSVLAVAGCTVRSSTVMLADGGGLSLDYGARAETLEGRRRATRIAGMFTAGAAAVTMLGLLLAWHAHAGLAAVRAETAQLNAMLSGEAARASTRVEAANLLHERRRQRLPAAAVLEELSQVLPQSVWLESVSLDDTKLELRGQGSGIPALIEILEQSDAFRDVNFSSATQLNAELNAEAFSIGATLDSAPEAAP